MEYIQRSRLTGVSKEAFLFENKICTVIIYGRYCGKKATSQMLTGEHPGHRCDAHRIIPGDVSNRDLNDKF